jgi:hypothetical protein
VVNLSSVPQRGLSNFRSRIPTELHDVFIKIPFNVESPLQFFAHGMVCCPNSQSITNDTYIFVA